MSAPLDAALTRLEGVAGPVLAAHPDLRDEIAQLFRTARVDRSMALARARRLLEVMVVDHYVRWKRLVPPFRNRLKPLYTLIEELGAGGALPRSAVSLCHAVRLEGNRAVHYLPDGPGDPKWAAVGDEALGTALRKLFDAAEALATGGYSVYLSSLPGGFAPLYERLHREWKPGLDGRAEGGWSLFEALDLLFRSVVPAMRAEWLGVLAGYAADGTLPAFLSAEDEGALRRLRNLGLIEHDGPWLFAPTRSRRVRPTPTGHVFLALTGAAGSAVAEPVARDVVRWLDEAVSEPEVVALLGRLSEGRGLSAEDRNAARGLRNRYLVTHDTEFLAGADAVRLTDLGYAVLGRCWSE